MQLATGLCVQYIYVPTDLSKHLLAPTVNGAKHGGFARRSYAVHPPFGSDCRVLGGGFILKDQGSVPR
ncbi:hypothetical protein E4T56_gene17976 [Termitomyces sp. T112]|nr:hypothetical protein E4T56_gene17976 [Termitomyces sp. T112]